MKNDEYSRDPQPMGMYGTFDVTMKQVNDGVAKAAAWAPCDTGHFKRA